MNEPQGFKVFEASPEHMLVVRELFVEYANSIGFDLSFQGFDQELAELPGKYSRPKGTILLVSRDTAICGCVALREFESDTAEMKRLYLRPAFQGVGIGRMLAEKIVSLAREFGYSRIRLDTAPTMNAAASLYRSIGFQEISAYRHNPVEGTLYFEKSLRD